MKIYKFSQLGKRGNNEDSLGTTDGLITVCDGMGGHNFGERASAFVVKNMLEAFEQRGKLSKMDIQHQLNKVQDDLNHLLDNEPELEKMGTTFTGIFLTPDVWYAAHIGDSRIYLFRPSENKLWHTWDHSLVGELMRTHEITVEAGRFHPMSNRISKAIIAQKDSKPVSASIVKLDNLKKGDVLLLCSDGVIESWGDIEFVKLFSDTSLTFEQKCEKLRAQCDANSKDNNTAIIAEIEEQDAFNFGNNDELDWTSFDEVEADYNQYVKDNSDDEEEVKTKVAPKPAPQPKPTASPKAKSDANTVSNKKNNKMIYVIIALVCVCIGVGAIFIFGGEKTKEKPEKPKKTQKVENKKHKNNTISLEEKLNNGENEDENEAQNVVTDDVETPTDVVDETAEVNPTDEENLTAVEEIGSGTEIENSPNKEETKTSQVDQTTEPQVDPTTEPQVDPSTKPDSPQPKDPTEK